MNPWFSQRISKEIWPTEIAGFQRQNKRPPLDPQGRHTGRDPRADPQPVGPERGGHRARRFAACRDDPPCALIGQGGGKAGKDLFDGLGEPLTAALEALETAGYANLVLMQGGFNLYNRHWTKKLNRRLPNGNFKTDLSAPGDIQGCGANPEMGNANDAIAFGPWVDDTDWKTALG